MNTKTKHPECNPTFCTFSGNRMGERFEKRGGGWLASVVTGGEWQQIKRLKVGESVTFTRGVTGAVGATAEFTIERVS